MTLLHNYVSKNALLYPNHLMIQDGDVTISYIQMDSCTNKLARYLVRSGATRGDGIGLFLPKSINLFKGLISALKTDSFYIPLNIQAPLERNRLILEQSKCRILCCDESTELEAQELIRPFEHILLVVIREELFKGESDASLLCKNTPEDLAYVLYTSGSTGRPKGVMVSHGSVCNYVEWTVDYFNIGIHDRLSSHPGLYFDLSVFDIYSAFKSGASLHLVPNSFSMFPVKIIDFIESNKITIWNSVPSLYTFAVRAKVLKPERLECLRILTFNGEVMPAKSLMEWMKACPNARFINQYGPTETTCASLYYEIPFAPEDTSLPIPIGRPIANTEVFALHEDGHESKMGEVGELHIAGSGLGKGYLGDLEKTKKAFIRDPLHKNTERLVYVTGDLVRLRNDGNYDYIGRKDHQIKVMGYRVELGEIETCLNGFDYIHAAAVLGLAHPHAGDTMIVAFIVTKHACEEIDDAQVKKDIQKVLPNYMLPRVILRLAEMPLSSNGKIDRHKLKNIYSIRNKT
jgi:amino acid adenylation domain-containing protein